MQKWRHSGNYINFFFRGQQKSDKVIKMKQSESKNIVIKWNKVKQSETREKNGKSKNRNEKLVKIKICWIFFLFFEKLQVFIFLVFRTYNIFSKSKFLQVFKT